MRNFLIILSALIVAGGSGFYLLQGLQPAQQVAAAEPAEVPKPIQILVPAAPLAAGTILVPTHLAEMPLDADAVSAEMVEADEDGRALLLGSVAIHPLPQGVPIARSSVVNPGERGFLAAVLPRGKRAISIPISETAGLSGLVMPGDRVDIILTYAVAGSVVDAEREIRASETVLANLRVLALDQRMNAGDASVADKANPNQIHPIARTATLEVTPQQAEMLTLATQLGGLSLVLNSVQDGGEPAEDDAATADLAAIAAAVTGTDAEAPAAERRALTLDSQVTSLLQRDFGPPAAAAAPAETVPTLAERIARVQVVRGIDIRAMEFAAEAAVANAAPAAAGPSPSLAQAEPAAAQ